MKETEKMLDIIHKNRNKIYNERQAKEEKEKKEDKRFKVILTIGCLVAMLLVGVVACKYTERQVKNCMESGKSETFCRYAGE